MKTLLIIIDLQKGWRHKTATETAMLRTVELCKSFAGDIIHCCFRNDENSLFYNQLKWDRFFRPEETDQIPEIASLDLPIKWRSTYSCLTEEVLELVKKYEQVFIAGVFTDISVSVTAMEIFDLNIPVSVVTDCVATLHGEDVHAAALKALDFGIGKDHLIRAASLV